jgi:thiol-disulfide isomerase/thioredoxin
MDMTRSPRARSIAALLILATAGVSSARSDDVAAIPWQKDFKAALREARATGKPVLVDFWAEWCEWCHKLDATTYRDAKVVALAREFVPVKVDTEGSLGERELSKQYGVEILPTIAFLSPSGRLFIRHATFEGPETFPATLESARRLAAEVSGFEAALARDHDDPAALAGLGLLLADQQLAADSREVLRRAVRADHSRPAAERKRTRRALAELEGKAGKHPEAERLLKEALALTPADAAEDAAASKALSALAGR